MQKEFLGPRNEVLLEGKTDAERVLVFLPGISGLAHSARFAGLVGVAEAAGMACARIALWEGHADGLKMTYDDILERLRRIFMLLADRGVTDVVFVGKSFGGGVALAFQHELISQKILWAPAIDAAEEGNFEIARSTPVGEFEMPFDIILGKDFLSTDETQIDIIHGSADTFCPVENSEHIADRVPNGSLYVFKGADHSFTKPEHAKKLLEMTVNLLQ